MSRIATHLRHNLIAYIALFVALGGTSYAAINVGKRAVNPSNLNGRYIGGYVRGWVKVSARGRVVASGGGARVVHTSGDGTGAYGVDWSPRPTSSCTSIGSVDFTINTNGTPGYLVSETISKLRRGEREASDVQVYNAQGQPAALPSDLALVCATPR